MWSGKKSIAFKIFYDAIDIVDEKNQDDEKSALEIWNPITWISLLAITTFGLCLEVFYLRFPFYLDYFLPLKILI